MGCEPYNEKGKKLDNPIAEVIKEYIATNYGVDNCVASNTGTLFGAACMADALATPLPPGYTKDDLCTEEIITWAYDNVGWCTGAPPPQTGSISCTSTPSGASVTVAGKTGTTPCTLTDIPVGTYTVTYTKSGHQTCYDTGVVIVAGQTTSSNCTLQEVGPSVGSIYCTSTPSFASVSIAGKTGMTPCTLTDIPPGTYTATYTLSGYNPCTDSVTVVAGQTAQSNCDLTTGPAPPGTGTVEIKKPIDAVTSQELSAGKIYLDGQYIHHYAPYTITFGPGEQPYPGISAELGNHTIRVEKTGYLPWEQAVYVMDGSALIYSPRMTSEEYEIPEIEIIPGISGEIITLSAPDRATPGESIPITVTCTSDPDITIYMKLRATIGENSMESTWINVAPNTTTTLNVSVNAPLSIGNYHLLIELLGAIQLMQPAVLDKKTHYVIVSGQPGPGNVLIEPPHVIPATAELRTTAEFEIGVTNYRTSGAIIYAMIEEIHTTQPGVQFSQQSTVITIPAGMHISIPVSWYVEETTPLGVYEVWASLYEGGLKLGRSKLATAEIHKNGYSEFVKKLVLGYLR